MVDEEAEEEEAQTEPSDEDEPPKKQRRKQQKSKTSSSQSGEASQSKKQKKKTRKNDDDDEYELSATNKQALEDISAENRSELIGSILRYAIFCNSKKAAVKREEITKLIKSFSKKLKFEAIFKDVLTQLQDVFGYTLLPLEKQAQEDLTQLQQATQDNNNNEDANGKKAKRAKSIASHKSWMLAIAEEPSVQYHLSVEEMSARAVEFIPPQEYAERGLLYILLSLIETSANGFIVEEEMWERLQQLGLKPDAEDSVFGNVNKVIQNFVHQHYLEKKKIDEQQQQQNDGKTEFKYLKGPRALQEVHANGLKTSVHQIVGTGKPSFFGNNDASDGNQQKDNDPVAVDEEDE